jgi:hypothetical protein
MYRFRASLFVAAVLGLALTLATPVPVNAQRSEDGTGAGAGNSPPIDQLRGGAAMPDATGPMDAPPMPPDHSAGQTAPSPDTAAPEENKKDDGTPPTDAPTGGYPPD